MKNTLKVIKFFLIWRLILFVPVIFGSLFLDYGSSYPFFEISYYKNLPNFLNIPLFKIWANFDGVHYLNIATNGYITEARFFPLFPLLIFLLSLGNIFFPLTFLIGIIIPNLFLILALVLLNKLLRLDYPQKTVTQTAAFLLVFPTSFFLVSTYTESLFLALLISSFYFARQGKWAWAIIAGFFLISTRFVGVFIIPALIYEYLIQNRFSWNFAKISAIILITPIGLFFYSIYNFYHWGNPVYFLTAHSELGNSRQSLGLILPPQTIFRYFKILTSLPIFQFEWWVALLELGAFLFGMVMLFIAWKKKVRASYLIFGLLAFLLPVMSGTFSGLPRYLLIVFPIFIATALLESKLLKRIYFIAAAGLLFILLMFFTKGFFIA